MDFRDRVARLGRRGAGPSLAAKPVGDDRKGQAAWLDRRNAEGDQGSYRVAGMSLEFGVFDHLDRNDLPLSDYYEERLKVIEAFDRAGFFAYHVAEHHFTPLGMAPSPSVFLSAIGQRTRRLRFGTFVYALPVHHPLRVR